MTKNIFPKLISVVLVLVMVMSLAACGSASGNGADLSQGDDSGKIKVKLRHYVMRPDNSKRRYRKIMVEYYAKLVWYTLTMNKAERVRNQMKIRTAKMMRKRGI